MESMRIASIKGKTSSRKCSRCPAANPRWDRINGTAFCPNCQEGLVQGEGSPLTLRTAKKACAVCRQIGTVCYLTYPLEAPAPVEMDLCADHLRDLLGRSLDPAAYHRLRRQFDTLGFPVEDIFMLHGAFYDSQGNALNPLFDMDKKYRRAG